MPDPELSLAQQARELTDAWTKADQPPATDTAPPVEAPPTEPAPTTETPPAEPPAPPTPAEAEYIEALIREAQGDTPAETLKIPVTAKLPLKRGTETIYEPAKDVLESGMRWEDYKAKTREVGEARRELEDHAARVLADTARLQAREKWIEEEKARLREAQQDPEKWERYQTHLTRLAEDAEYAQTYKDALAHRERLAEDEATAAARYEEAKRTGVQQATTWIMETAQDPKYRGVDPDRVRLIYAQQLERGVAGLDPSAVEAIFAQEAQYLSSASPLTQKVAELEAKIAALTNGNTAAQHNAQTAQVLRRAAAPPVITGAPAAPSIPPSKVPPFTLRELPDVINRWAKQG